MSKLAPCDHDECGPTECRKGLDGTPCSHRSVTFWYSDTEDAAGSLVAAAMQYRPEERENFLKDVFLAAKVQLVDANA